MNKMQENEASRLKEVLSFIQLHDATFAPIPNYVATKGLLLAVNDTLQKQIDSQQINLKAYTLDKESKHEKLIRGMLEEAGKLNLLGIDIGDILIQGQAKHTKSSLRGLRDSLLISKARNLHSNINDHLAALAPYGITAASQAAFEQVLDSYNAVIDQKNQAASVRKSAIAECANTLRNVVPLLKRLRLLISTLHDEALLSQFDSAAHVKKLGVRHYNLEGAVKALGTLSSINNALITIYDAKGITHTAKTNLEGYYHFKGIGAGEYKVVVSKNGFDEQHLVFELISGKLTTLDVQLVPSEVKVPPAPNDDVAA